MHRFLDGNCPACGFLYWATNNKTTCPKCGHIYELKAIKPIVSTQEIDKSTLSKHKSKDSFKL